MEIEGGPEIHVFTYINPDTGESIDDKTISGCPLTDMGNAARFITYFGDSMRFCADRKKWYLWNGIRWVPDEKGVIFEYAKESVIKIHQEIQYIAKEDKARREGLSKFAYKSESQKSLRDMIANAQTDGRIAVTSSEFDANLDLMNFPNGTLDLKNKEFREHKREDLLTKLTAEPLDFEALGAYYFPTLIKALPLDEAVYAQLLLGSFLEYTTQNKEWSFIYGMPFAMKSSVTQPVYKALGDYAAPFPIELFIKNKQPIRSNQARPELIALEGVRIAWSEEAPPNFVIDEAILKSLTSSGEKSTREMYQTQRDLQLGCSFIIESNGTFTFDIDDEWSRDAALERTRVMKFINGLPPAERDKEVLKILTHDKNELRAALAWVVMGYFMYKAYGIETPETVAAANKEFEAIINPLSWFVKNELEFNNGGYVTLTALLDRFQEVATRDQVKLFPNERSLNIQLKKILPYFAQKEGVTVEAKKLSEGVSWLNISLKDLEAELLESEGDEEADTPNKAIMTEMTQNSVFMQSILNLKSYMGVLHKIGVLRHSPVYPEWKTQERASFEETGGVVASVNNDAKYKDIVSGEAANDTGLEGDLNDFIDGIGNDEVGE
jgi:putative DNA primase/helicase